MTKKYVLSIDQGTTSSRAVLFDQNYQIVASGQKEFTQIFPHSGWVEHDVEEIWQTVLASCQQAMADIDIKEIATIGITNQRETTVVWNKNTGKAVYNAIVWQDRRTAEACDTLKEKGLEKEIKERTGLLLDPYFSATKIAWILENVPEAQEDQLLFGTIDSFLLWRFNKVHATDASNASRTLLYDIHENRWHKNLLDIFKIPASMLPKVMDNAADFGVTDKHIFGHEIPITCLIGDQQSALVGQACFTQGMVKSTYGTGCFIIMNTGDIPIASNHNLLTTVGFQLNGKPTYALEGSIFVAGAAVQWLRDGLGVINSAEESGPLARQADDNQSVYLVPAFVGLGAPHWDPHCRGALFGLTRGTGHAELAKATLESVCYQTYDLLSLMQQEGKSIATIRVDGAMSHSNWTMQTLADILNTPIDRPFTLESTALGAAYFAGMHVGFYPDIELFSKQWQAQRKFLPKLPLEERNKKIAGWKDAVQRTLSNYTTT